MGNHIFKQNEEFGNYKTTKVEEIPELKYNSLNSTSNESKNTAYELRHNSGARILYLENNDPEKSFCIGFKTLPKDSTGVFHILEHSVLCGSRKFPVKEPFTNLLKSSMYTFLNAMTFPDKTIYPVASTNEKDLYNLVDVYMDAVFFPNIYKNKNIFYQEGGHPTCEQTENSDDDNTKDKTYKGYNGVVYNEMKGVYSEPQEHLFENILKQLYPDSCYTYSSGGEPTVIKDLTYSEFLAQHALNYSLENSYIILYGDMDIKKMLNFLDENYLSNTNEINAWRKEIQNELHNYKTGTYESNIDKYNSQEKECKNIYLKTSKENACCGIGYNIPRDHKKMIATKVLLEALTSSNESPLKSALLAENFSSEIEFNSYNEFYEPLVIVECHDIKCGAGRDLHKFIKDKLQKIIDNTISKDLLKASISNLEFKLKENICECTTGLDASINLFTEWLYDEDSSTTALKYIDDLKWLKEIAETDYFDELAKEIFINNDRFASVEIIPTDDDKQDKSIILNNEEIIEVNQICTDLSNWQNTQDKPEDEAKIPTMKISDISEITQYPKWNKVDTSIPCIKYDMDTNGISHANRYYSLNSINFDDLPYVSILTNLLGKLDTENYEASQLDLVLQSKIGHLNIRCNYFAKEEDLYNIDAELSIRTSALEENTIYLAKIIDEVIYRTKYDNPKKIKTILMQQKVALEHSFLGAGHIESINRALSHILPSYKAVDKTYGIEYYRFLKDLTDNYEDKQDELIVKLKKIAKTIFDSKPTISFAGENASFETLFSALEIKDVNTHDNKLKIELNETINEAFTIPSNVNYNALVYDLRLEKNNDYNINIGNLITASKIISLEYLWNEVRVKNGAYGSGMLLNNRGTLQFYSYRDPKFIETYAKYEECGKWLSDFNIDQTKLDNFIISSVAKIDAPIPVRSIMLKQDIIYFTNEDYYKREKIRTEIIQTNLNDIKQAGKVISNMTKKANKTSFGSKDLNNAANYNFNVEKLI